jgi:hypothetical protein
MTKKQSRVQSFSDAVVVGVDGHDSTHAALLWAAAEAGRRKTRLVVMTIQEAYTHDLPFGAGVDEATAIADTDTDVTARLAAQAARDAVPGLKVSTVRPEGQARQPPHQGLQVGRHDRARKPRQTQAGVCRARHHRLHHRDARQVPGRHRSPRPFRRPRGRPGACRRRVDGSRDSSLAIDAAADLAGKDGHVNVVNAWWFSMAESGSLVGGDVVEEDKIRARHARGVRNIAAAAQKRHPKVTFTAVSVEGE